MKTLAAVALVVGAVAGAGIAVAVVETASPTPSGNATDGTDPATVTFPDVTLSDSEATVTQFQNRTAFESYVAAGQRRASGYPSLRFGGGGVARTTVAVEGTERTDVAREPVAEDAGGDSDGGGSTPSRIADTNVQVETLDEPDIVKTDGQNFYYAPQRHRYEPVRPEPRRDERDGRRPPRESPDTHVIDASDPDAPAVVGELNTTGKLLQTGDSLIVFERDRVAGYDVSDPENPTETWSHPLNGSVVTAREANGTVYLVTESRVGPGTDCPIRPLGEEHAVECTDIYRPGAQVPVDATYTAFSIDAADGAVRDSVSFVGTGDNSVVYVSEDALYVTYTQRADRAAVVGTYVREGFDRTPESVNERVAQIQSYNISSASKLREIRMALERWMYTLPADERRAVREEFREGLAAYLGEHNRQLTRTGIVRVNVTADGLAVESTGTVPGEPLNQFAMDQREGTLRIATTVPRTGDAESQNDLYTLDATTLDRRGAVTGMGDDQRVYAVRYVGDTAYVVTFRQVDPLHVVDLSDPDRPVETGTLELPGYSSYLHPIDDDTVLGIGEEDGKVKAVLFDVSDPGNPTIEDSKVFDRRYSAVSDTHHAFLIDRRHGVFVLPAGQESLVVDYTGGQLTTEATVETDARATRTRYVEDSLYVFAGETVTVVDETTWEETTTLELAD